MNQRSYRQKSLSMAAADLAGLASEVVRNGGTFEFRATGHSMVPAILPGERVVLAGFGTEGPLPGQVVLAQVEGRAVLHRLVRLGQRAVVAGDNPTSSAIEVPPEALVARVVRVRIGARGFLRRWLLRFRGAAAGLLRTLAQLQRHHAREMVYNK